MPLRRVGACGVGAIGQHGAHGGRRPKRYVMRCPWSLTSAFVIIPPSFRIRRDQWTVRTARAKAREFLPSKLSRPFWKFMKHPRLPLVTAVMEDQ